MRIIKKVIQEYKHKCTYYKSIYAYTQSDVDHSFYNYIRCPVCNGIESTSIFDKKIKEKE